MIRRTLLHANERGSFRETPCRDFRLTTALERRDAAGATRVQHIEKVAAHGEAHR